MGQEQDGGALFRDQALLDPDGMLRISPVLVVGILEFVVSLPTRCSVVAEGILTPAVQVVVAGIGMEGHDSAVGVLHADGTPMGVAPRIIVLEIDDDVAEDLVPQARFRIVIVDQSAFDPVIRLETVR